MADSTKPTAANILSSLGIKGAIPKIPQGAVGTTFAGYVPVLDENGKINVDFIPSSAVEKVVRPISNVALVDPNTLVEAENRTGSAVAPYKTVKEASQKVSFDASKRCALLLMPGKYTGNDNAYANFAMAPTGATIAIIGIGPCEIDASSFRIDHVQGSELILQNVRTNNSISVPSAATVTCLGRTYIGGELDVSQITVKLSSDSTIGYTNASEVKYLSDASRIGYDSDIPDDTVKKALDRIGARKIRVANVTFDDDGFSFDEDSYTDLDASSGIYDLRQREKVFVDGINRLVELNKNINADSVTAKTIKAELVETDKLKMQSLVFGGYKLAIDSYGYLVVADADTPIVPPSGVILISDSAPGNDTVYALIVVNGRMRIMNADIAEDVDPAEVVTELHMTDSSTGAEYTVTVNNGRIVLDGDSNVSVT